ncbi:MAG: MBL fold metallo-hydrolase [bacterium]|nr:MBL fold metallo-hydrolase [bacterium]MCP5068518.1 MBL fold metallo-hydrolase [bacterium]
MKVRMLPVTPLQQNCAILACEKTGRAAVVDPGGDVERIVEVLDELGLELEAIFVTHAHADHAGAVDALQKRFGVTIEGPHSADRNWVRTLAVQGKMMGVQGAKSFTPDRWLEEGDRVHFGEVELEVLHCPGHTPGHVAFYDRADRIIIAGDLLFEGSIGRSDFPGGDHATLLRSISEKLLLLGDDVVVVPGHGQPTTIGRERESNPFLQKPR